MGHTVDSIALKTISISFLYHNFTFLILEILSEVPSYFLYEISMSSISEEWCN